MSDEDEGSFVEYDENDLITPREALDSILHYAGSEYQAKQIIADALHSGKITSFANVMWEEDEGDPRDEWTPRQREGYDYYENIQLPEMFFRESNTWPDDLTFWDWEAGDFVIFVSDPAFDPEPARFCTKGVRLLRKEVLALVGRSNRKGIGGKKPDRERWAEFWLSVLYNATSDKFDWTQFDNPNQLKTQILTWTDAWSDSAFSDTYLDSTIETIWKQLVQRCADERKAPLS